jgi:hypothetical protein
MKWVAFGLFCLLSWVAAAFFLLISGWAPCTVTGWCIADRIVFVIILLLLPAEVAVAAYMRHRERVRNGE